MNRNFVPQAGRGRGYNQGYNAPSPGPQFRQLPKSFHIFVAEPASTGAGKPAK